MMKSFVILLIIFSLSFFEVNGIEITIPSSDTTPSEEQECVNKIPEAKHPKDCTDIKISGGKKCCYAHSYDYHHWEKSCVPVEYRGQKEYSDKYLDRYGLDCGDADYKIEKYKRCGPDYPMSAVDCWMSSTERKSCCFASKNESVILKMSSSGGAGGSGGSGSSGTDGVPVYGVYNRCFWYKKKQGTFTVKKDKINGETEDLTFECSSGWLIFNLNSLVVLIFLLIH